MLLFSCDRLTGVTWVRRRGLRAVSFRSHITIDLLRASGFGLLLGRGVCYISDFPTPCINLPRLLFSHTNETLPEFLNSGRIPPLSWRFKTTDEDQGVSHRTNFLLNSSTPKESIFGFLSSWPPLRKRKDLANNTINMLLVSQQFIRRT